MLDERVRRGGSHHQKLVLLRRARPEDDVAFVGGIDLCHGRHDDPTPPRRPPGDRAQPAIRGSAAVARHPARGARARGRRSRAVVSRTVVRSHPVRPPQPGSDRAAPPHPATPPTRSAPPGAAGPAPRRHRRGPGPPHLSVEATAVPLRARRRAQHRTRVPQGVEPGAAPRLPRGSVPVVTARGRHARRRAAPVARAAPDRGGPAVSRTERAGGGSVRDDRPSARAGDALRRGRRPRRGVRPREPGRDTDLRARQGLRRRRHLARSRIRQPEPPIVDPRLRAVVRHARHRARSAHANGSRRSRRPRAPARARHAPPFVARAPGSSGRPRTEEDDDADLVDFTSGFAAFRATADALDAWHRAGCVGPRPPGHVRPHRPKPVPWHSRWWAHAAHRVFVDPDGRPRALRRRDAV